MTIAHRGLLAALLATGLLASGCRKAPEPPPADDNLVQPSEPAPDPVAPPPETHRDDTPKPIARAEEPVAPDDSKPSADEQMREDAEATGMTSRTPSSDGSAPGDAAPADGGNSSN